MALVSRIGKKGFISVIPTPKGNIFSIRREERGDPKEELLKILYERLPEDQHDDFRLFKQDLLDCLRSKKYYKLFLDILEFYKISKRSLICKRFLLGIKE